MFEGYAAAHKPGIAALRHYRDARIGANFHDLRDFRRRGRLHKQRRFAGEQPALVADQRVNLARIRRPALGSHRRPDALQRFHVHTRHDAGD
jgi:hypothetical protein